MNGVIVSAVIYDFYLCHPATTMAIHSHAISKQNNIKHFSIKKQTTCSIANMFKSTSTYHQPPIESRKHNVPVLLFIPGNPGLVEFYITYLNLVQQKFPTFEIFCISHAGYETEVEDGEFEFYSFDYQINHKFDIIKLMILEKNKKDNKQVDLYFMSHSFGSYLIPRVIEKLIKDKEIENRFTIKLAGLICPTLIDIEDSQSGLYFTWLFSWIPFLVPITVALSSLLKLIFSEATLRRIIGNKVVQKPVEQDEKSIEGWENSVTGCYNLFRSNNIIRHSLMLCQKELELIKPDEETYDWFFEKFPVQYDCQIWTFYADFDYWIHDTSRDHFLERYAGELKNKNLWFTVDDTGITHSFCVNQSVEFAKITVEKLAMIFPDGIQ